MRKLYILGLIGLIGIVASAAFAEELTLTTYYPAPYGVYREMRSQRMAIGNTYYDSTQHCWPDGPCFPTDIPDEADLVVEGNVGIGTTSPAVGYKLDVQGAIQATAFDVGDITFRDQKSQKVLWRMFEDEDGLYLENKKTGKVYKFVLQEIK